MEYLLAAENISKSFPGVRALKSVEFKIKKGTVHALMGENGAGKSTLMKILIGIYTPDEGTIHFNGNKVQFHSTQDALNIGISMIHQELNPVPHMTVAENIFLGKEPLKYKKFIDFKKIYADTHTLLQDLNIKINPQEKMINLSVGQMQMVEIAKAISYDSELIIMDEPTSAITENEVAHLFRIIEQLKKKNIAIIFITHKMDEVYKITDEITVYRDGEYIGTGPTKDINKESLIQMMVGREVTNLFPKEQVAIGETVLEVKNLTRENEFENVSFELKKGEILGFAGLIGSGRTEVLECLFGVTDKDKGEIIIHGNPVNIKNPRHSKAHNIALLTEDRKLSGLYLALSVRDNIIMSSINDYRHWGLLSKKEMEAIGMKQKDLLNIKTPHLNQLIVNLSGGNQQKVLIARWLLTNPDILILDEPTRGIDVGAKSEIHSIMTGLVKQGKSIIMISSELPEVLGMSDRIIVMHEGTKSGELLREEATQEKILHLATGETLDTFDSKKYQ